VAGLEGVVVPGFVLAHTQQWMRYFTGQGHDPKPLAAGVEGAIYDLGSGLVAKVWRDRRPAGLVRMQSFYADVRAAGLPFMTPEILAVGQADGTSVTYERKLPGEPLARRLSDGDDGLDPVAARCVTDVLQALSTVPATAAMRQLAVLDFGFLTTAGDPRLDAAIAAGVMNMYGPHAPAITGALTARLAHDLGYPADVLLTYQAAYPVATSNAFTSDGSDGHFAWCIGQLRRPDITELLSS
jgi:hypothetical protein